MGFTSEGENYKLPATALDGKRMPVDTYYRLYKYLTALRGQTGDYERNEDGEPISHLLGLFRFTTDLLEVGAEPVFVFEGGWPDLKAETLSDRGERKDNARDKYEDAKDRGDEDAMQKWGPRTARVTDSMVDDCKTLLDALGVPYVDAATEADPQCAYLAKQDGFDYVMSADSDVLLYGAPAILRDWDGESAELYPLKSILDETGLTRDELIQTQILQGCDYNDGAYGVGWVYSKRYVKESPSFEAAMEKAAEKDESIDRSRMREVYSWFQNPEITAFDPDTLEMASINPTEVKYYLCEEMGMDARRVQQALRTVIDR